MREAGRMLQSVRKSGKALVERGLAASGAGRLSRRLHRDSAVILAYHNVVPRDASPAGDRSLHLAQEDFAAQLDVLARTHSIVALDELLRGDPDPDGQVGPRAALTFDDAYRGAMTAGLAELGRRDLPATIFVAPGRLGDRSFWWDDAAESLGGLDAGTRSELLEQLAGRHEAVAGWMRDRGLSPGALPDHARTVTEDELGAAVRSSLFTVGSHTWSHPNLPALARSSRGSVEEELVRSRRWLSERFPGACRPWLAYPYGAVCETVRDVAAATGYEFATLVRGGMFRPEMVERRARSLPRFNVPAGISLDGFRLRIDGLLPFRWSSLREAPFAGVNRPERR